VRPRHTCGAVAMFGVVLLAFIPSLSAQEQTAAGHVGFPQDWSQHQVVFSRDGLAQHPEAMKREARVRQQMMQRVHSQDADIFQSLGPEALQRIINPYIESLVDPRIDRNIDPLTISTKRPGPHRDWNVSFVAARLGPHVFPAKYSFDPSAPPDCVKDFVVYGLSIPGVTGGQANLVGFNNLYVNPGGTGSCPGTAPNVMFAYNISGLPTTGKIVTSPILSEDGTKIGFVESGTGANPFSIFHTVTWASGLGQGTITDSVVPSAMTSLTLTTAANCTTSAPWIDFDADVVYLGDDTGNLYKIDGAFKGTPTVEAGWPIIVSATKHLSPPVLDSTLGLLMVGSQNGDLYQIDTALGAVVETLIVGSGGTTSGIVAPPVVDITNGTTFVVSANDGTSAVLVEAETATLSLMSKGQIGQGSVHGTALRLYEPAFDNAYYNDPSTGVIRLCGTGTGDQSPWQYAFGFSGITMNTVSTSSSQLITSVNARCTGWTEFFNPNVGLPLGTDYFFFGLSQDCTGTGVAFGCLAEITDTNTTPLFVTLSGGPSGIVADNYSLAAEASSIYMAAEGANVAYKFTQNGLH